MAVSIKEVFKINSSIQNSFPLLSCVNIIDDQTVIITESSNLTLVYDLSKQFCVKSFTFTSLLPLTAPVVYDSTTENLVALKNKTKIDLIDLQTDESKSIKLAKDQPVSCILTSKNSSCLLLFENNCIYELDNLYENKNFCFDQCLKLEVSCDQQIQKIKVIDQACKTENKLVFWIQLINKQKDIIYKLFKYDFKTKKLIKAQEVCLNDHVSNISIDLSEEKLLTISKLNKLKIIDQFKQEDIIDLPFSNHEKVLSHCYLTLDELTSALIIMIENKNENSNYLVAYDLNLKKEIKRLLLPNRFCDQLISLDSNIFVLANSAVYHVPCLVENLALVDMIESESIEKNYEKLTNDNIFEILDQNIKPIDKEVLLVELLQRFISNSNDLNDIKKLFSYIFNHEFMIIQLRKKEFDRSFLTKLFNLFYETLTIEDFLKKNLLDWINVCLDSYFICLNSSKDDNFIEILLNIETQLNQMMIKCKDEKDLKFLFNTVLLALNGSNKKHKTILLPDKKHLGYQLDEIYL